MRRAMTNESIIPAAEPFYVFRIIAIISHEYGWVTREILSLISWNQNDLQSIKNREFEMGITIPREWNVLKVGVWNIPLFTAYFRDYILIEPHFIRVQFPTVREFSALSWWYEMINDSKILEMSCLTSVLCWGKHKGYASYYIEVALSSFMIFLILITTYYTTIFFFCIASP